MTGFGGHMTSVNFMNVHLEEPLSVEEDAMDSSSLFNQIPDLSDYFATRGNNGDKKNERKRAHTTDPRVRYMWPRSQAFPNTRAR